MYGVSYPTEGSPQLYYFDPVKKELLAVVGEARRPSLDTVGAPARALSKRGASLNRIGGTQGQAGEGRRARAAPRAARARGRASSAKG